MFGAVRKVSCLVIKGPGCGGATSSLATVPRPTEDRRCWLPVVAREAEPKDAANAARLSTPTVDDSCAPWAEMRVLGTSYDLPLDDGRVKPLCSVFAVDTAFELGSSTYASTFITQTNTLLSLAAT